MNIEIERKFLVRNDFLLNTLVLESEFIRQAYLLNEENRNIRIRKKGEKAFITFKSGKETLKRLEFEYEIPKEDFAELEKIFSDRPSIEKHRHAFNYEGMRWEIDVFLGANNGLVLAEIELENESQKFKKPEWVGREVTNNPNYLNANLAKHPYSEWSEKV